MSRALSREQIVRLIEGVNLAGSREEAEALIRKANNKGDCSDGDAAYAERSRRLQEAYRDEGSDDVPGQWGIAHDAKLYRRMRLHQLLMAVHRMAARMDQLDPPKRRRGAPGGGQRWRSALQVAAYLVERRKEAWRIGNGNVPAKKTVKFVDEVIADMHTWDATKRSRWLRFKRLSQGKVLALLREQKSRRL
jgi:hypothetical protein